MLVLNFLSSTMFIHLGSGGGRVEVDRREEEEGGEGDTDSQADRLASYKTNILTYFSSQC